MWEGDSSTHCSSLEAAAAELSTESSTLQLGNVQPQHRKTAGYRESIRSRSVEGRAERQRNKREEGSISVQPLQPKAERCWIGMM